MQYIFRLVHGFPHNFYIRDASLDHSDLVAYFRQIVFLAGREVVEHDDAVTAANEFVHRV